MRLVSVIISIFILITFNLSSQNSGVSVFTGCATDQLMSNKSTLLQIQNKLNSDAYAFFLSSKTHKTYGVTATIPVVVHIIHNGGPENISNAQVLTAISNINAKRNLNVRYMKFDLIDE